MPAQEQGMILASEYILWVKIEDGEERIILKELQILFSMQIAKHTCPFFVCI